MERTNPFGAVAREGTPFDWVDGPGEPLSAVWEKLRPVLQTDSERLKASGWGDSWPDMIAAGDIAPLRLAGSGLRTSRGLELADAVMTGKISEYFARRLIEVDLRRLERTYSSELVYLNAGVAVDLLGAYRPEPELVAGARLPWRKCLVVFGAPLRFDAASTHWDLGDALELESVDQAVLANNNMPDGNAKSTPAGLWSGGGALYGVGLASDEKGRLDDWVMWHVFSADQASGALAEPTVQIGRLSRATLAPLIENLVCALTWGKFVQRERIELPERPSEVRKLVNTGSFKRRAKNGDVDGIRVLDLSHNERVGPEPRTEPGTRRTVSAHLRRGHWRRVRVVTRDDQGQRVGSRGGEQGVDWNYAGRWIQPVLVSGAGETTTTTRIYRLPEPPTAEEWEALKQMQRSEGDHQTL